MSTATAAHPIRARIRATTPHRHLLAPRLVTGGALLVTGPRVRVAAGFGVCMMLGALYAHAVIDVWPNAPGMQEPPLVLPIVVLMSSAYALWRGAGRWSLDRRRAVWLS